jgi:hypothetical protein
LPLPGRAAGPFIRRNAPGSCRARRSAAYADWGSWSPISRGSRARPPRASVPTPPNAFDTAFLTQAQAEEEPLTASEAELAGPWKLELLHPDAGWPGAVAVLRVGESLDKGDVQGPTVRGWLRVYRPEVAAGLHLLEGLVRSPFHLATVGDAAGGAALTQVGRLLAELLAAKQGGRRLDGPSEAAAAALA